MRWCSLPRLIRSDPTTAAISRTRITWSSAKRLPFAPDSTAESAQWHKWRHTYATNLLHSGIDVRTLQLLLGHKNLSTTEKYLKALRVADLSKKIEASSLAKFVA